MKVFKESYTILNLRLELSSDSETFFQIFQQDYSAFLSQDFFLEAENHTLRVSYLSEGESGYPVLIINGERHSLQDHPDPALHAFRIVSRFLVTELRSFFIVHAAVAAYGRQALVVSGRSGIGKTTLVLELAKAGFTLLSDDFCPIHRANLKIYPFPRSVLVKKKPSEVTSSHEYASSETGRIPFDGKVRIPLDGRAPESGQIPYTPACLICLDSTKILENDCTLEITLKPGRLEAFQASAEKLAGDGVTFAPVGSCVFRLRYPLRRGLTSKVTELLTSYRSSLWDCYRVDSEPASFESEPKITRIQNHEAAFFLLREMKWELFLGTSDPLTQTAPVKTFMKLNDIFQDVPCFRLEPGRLETMTRLVMEAFRQGTPS